MTKAVLSKEQFDDLCSTRFVRERSRRIYDKALAGGTRFRLDLAKLPACADFVRNLILKNYPDLKVPFHSRWEHFNVGSVDRIQALDRKLATLASRDKAYALTDLVLVSVLLDAGAGPDWAYKARDGGSYSRSEGLAVASLEIFEAGLFSSDSKNPHRVDSKALKALKIEDMRKAFQISAANPMTGLEGRIGLMQKLGECLEKRGDFFTQDGLSRPGYLLDWYATRLDTRGQLPAQTLLRGLLWGLGDMWPERFVVNDCRLGDAWVYPHGAKPEYENIVAFHKLSQWLSYSMIHPLEVSGLAVSGITELTGLPEYRNGGLFTDMEVLVPRAIADIEKTHAPDGNFLIEWRALTVCLLDETAKLIRKDLKLSDEELPLGKVLQGGTWLAGRETAKRLRGGQPPFKIESDGTVF
ncbi:MAG: DUF1688 family protein [Bdellovibrionota bacterium]